MDVADDVVAEVAVNALDALADDGGAQMADVQGLCHVWPAVVEHDAAGLALTGHAEALAVGRVHIQQRLGQRAIELGHATGHRSGVPVLQQTSRAG